MTRRLTVAVLLLAIATAAVASWYDDYDAGLKAVRAGNWSAVVTSMTAAIRQNPNEGNRVRTYGVDFRNYHPYYYRGVANLNLGKYDQAVADLEKASGPGPENLGSIETLISRAKKESADNNAPAPDPTPVRPTPTPVNPTPVNPTPAPVVPSIDPALRQRASSALSAARGKLTAAQQRRATASPQYSSAMTMLTDATTRNATAKSNADYDAIIQLAENAGDLADLATGPQVAVTPSPAPVTPSPTAPVIPKSTAATDMVLDDAKRQLRRALENYFAGDFDVASRDFEALTRKLPNNAWIWAFLGASQYSQYAFEADATFKSAAERSFREAKRLRRWGKDGLPSRYFSRRIRRAFDTAG
jgi:tetratricopeptide (TPR) repeat protein